MTYELLRPADLGRTFEAVFEQCRDAGYRGINITYPYKERVVRYLEAGDPAVQMMGACNTVLFEPSGPQGFNTDHSGFVAAYRNRFGDALPGRVALAGAGGVGRAIGFALARLGASELRLFDLDRQKSVALADAIGSAHDRTCIRISTTIEEAAGGADGLVNATPVGMGGIGGCPFPVELICRTTLGLRCGLYASGYALHTGGACGRPVGAERLRIVPLPGDSRLPAFHWPRCCRRPVAGGIDAPNRWRDLYDLHPVWRSRFRTGDHLVSSPHFTNVMCFTTGRGSAFGCKPTPSIKLATNVMSMKA